MRKNPTESTSTLLRYYSFDLGSNSAEQIVEDLLNSYPAKWVIAAVIESIYQGRYKIASVNNILLRWYLNGHPQHRFDVEFADLICNNLSSKTEVNAEGTNLFSQKMQPFLPGESEETALNFLDQSKEFSESETLDLKIGNRGEIPNSRIEKWLRLIRKLA